MPEPKTTTVREFLRTGYRPREGPPTIVLNGAEIQGVWYPGTTGMTVNFTATQPAAKPARNGVTDPATQHPEGLPMHPPVARVRGLSKADQAKGRSRR